MRPTSFSHEFVESFPDELEEGVLYISIRYTSAAHNCACGCGNQVITPIKPSAWHLLFDGKSVSLWPSIGNWQFPCRSHYWIKRNQVRWAAAWTDEQIAAGRQREERDREGYFANAQSADNILDESGADATAERPSRSGLLRRILRWLDRF